MCQHILLKLSTWDSEASSELVLARFEHQPRGGGGGGGLMRGGGGGGGLRGGVHWLPYKQNTLHQLCLSHCLSLVVSSSFHSFLTVGERNPGKAQL